MFFRRNYKDSVFTDLFGSDRDGKKNFLELYNALSGNNFKLGEVSLERKVIEQTLYKTFNNDVSWEINGKLIVLVEHQSTVNENMPFRCLEYVTRIFEGIVPIKVRYQEKVYKIPNPDFYVVYVGKKDLPMEQELRLSDAFYTKDSSKLELIVKVKNCSNYMNLPISTNCDILKQYCRFLEIVEQNYSKHFKKRSLRHAIEIAKYDYKMDIAVKQEEAREEGISIGTSQKAIEDAKNALEMGLKPEQVSKIVSLPLEKVLELKKEIEANKA